MNKHYLTYNAVKCDQDGNRYLDVTSEALDDAGLVVLVPLVVAHKPNKVASSVNIASAAVMTATANDLRDMLSEADAILADSSDSSTDRREFSSNSMNASSSESVAGARTSPESTLSTTLRANHEPGMFALSLFLLLLIVVVSFVVGLIVGKF